MIKLLCLGTLIALGTANVAQKENVEKDRTITRVVKMLQSMLERSQKEANEERVIYAKFKCYCDTSEAEKRESIKKLNEQIALLENQIAEIQASTGGLSEDCAQLKKDMAENKQARDTAEALRKKENTAFLAEEADLSQAIDQCKEAINVLAEVGADQTKSVGADHKQFMAGYKAGLIQKQATVESALQLATEFMNVAQQKTASSFLQAPFTGTYTSQSAEVLGILKQMRDTFIKNLAEARTTEKERQEAFEKFMEIKLEEYADMEESYHKKQRELGGNDEELASKKQQLSDAQKQLASDEEFLEKLLPMCEEKAKSYDGRKMLRANEEAALSEAIAILNNDAAFATFGEVSATSSGGKGKGPLGFVQLSAVRQHQHRVADLQNVLQKAAAEANSARLKVLAKLAAENPFDTVLKEINKVLEIIEAEGKQDKENLDWCKKERDDNHAELKIKNSQIISLKKEIARLDDLINNEKTGLKVQIADQEDALLKNIEAQKTETAARLEENIAYQKDVKNLVEAQTIIKQAIGVLNHYYKSLEEKLANGEAGFIQEDPDPPASWENGYYEGQSGEATGVIAQLEFILKSTHDEENDAHKDEEQAQADYEDSMTKLKDEQKKGEENLVSLQDQLAEAEKTLLDTKEDLKATEADRDAIEAYLAKIKPGCDFIEDNFELREKNRGIEKKALEKCIELIKATPAYIAAVDEATVESYGKCKEPCVKDSEHVTCKACMADVTIPGFCAGHPETSGCEEEGLK
jgi:flagellar biosynthesis chaperone FliJ